MANGGGAPFILDYPGVVAELTGQNIPATPASLARAEAAFPPPPGGNLPPMPEDLPPGARWVVPGESYEIPLGGGYIGLREQRWNAYTEEYEYVTVERYKATTAGAGAAVDPFAEEKFLETIRHHKETEAIDQRQLALNTATDALAAYLTATGQVNERRRLALQGLESAFSEARELLPWLVDPAQEHFAGFEPGGTLAVHAERLGVPFTPVPIQHKQLIPGMLAQPIEGQPAGAPSPEVLQMIADILGV